MEDLHSDALPGLHRYSPVSGIPQLIEALADRDRLRTGLPTRAENVLLSMGATGGLAAVIGAITEPGDEVLVLAPYWPLIHGIVSAAHAVPSPVDVLGISSEEELLTALRGRLTEKTAAIYWSSPNNPTGALMSRTWLEALAAFAREHQLWLVCDEVYEDYAYVAPHVPGRTVAPERTFSVGSFSKAYGMAGNRLGFVIGPAEGMREVRRVSTHCFYAAPTAAQYAALRALDGRGQRWAAAAAREYAETGARAAALLGVPPPQGGTFLFFQARGDVTSLALRCAELGVSFALGHAFGPYPNHLRICFTAQPPETVLRGVELLAETVSPPP